MPHNHVLLEKVIGANTLVVSANTKLAIAQAARRSGVIAGQAIIDSGARLWSLLMNRNNSLVILSGNSGCGKTTLRETIISAMRDVGAPRENLHAGGDSLHSLRCMEKVLQVAEKWLVNYNRRKQKKREKELMEEVQRKLEEEYVREEEEELRQAQSATMVSDNDPHAVTSRVHKSNGTKVKGR